MKTAHMFFIITILVPSYLHAFPYEYYNITSNGPDYTITGYATIHQHPIIYYNNIVQSSAPYIPPQQTIVNDLKYRFTLSYSLSFNSGIINTGTGYIDLVDTYSLNTYGFPQSHNSTEDSWKLGEYSMGSGFGYVNLDLGWTTHNLLTSPVTELPNSFGLSNFFADEFLFFNTGNFMPSSIAQQLVFTADPQPVPEPAITMLFVIGILFYLTLCKIKICGKSDKVSLRH